MPPVKYDKEALQADWRTGDFTSRDIAHKYKISIGLVSKLTKGLPKDLMPLVNKKVEVKQELARLDEKSVNAVNTVVHEKTKHIQFFNNATIKNIQTMVKKIDEETTIAEHRLAQDAIAKGRETVLGKQPDTAIQINNNVNNSPLEKMTDAELAAIIAQG
jgi:hypothetical protein